MRGSKLLKLTCFTVFPKESKRTTADISINTITTATLIKTRIALTLIDICRKNDKEMPNSIKKTWF